jgi:hypothetical protein
MGAEWPEYFVFLGRNRDSDALERSNFDAGLAAVGGEQTSDDGTELVVVVRENHFLCGWVEWIAIHETAVEALAKATAIAKRLDNYPVVSEELLSEYETEEAQQVWMRCYDVNERIAYIRAHRSQFEFNSLADVLGCVRGEYFAGYASELIY